MKSEATKEALERTTRQYEYLILKKILNLNIAGISPQT
jgi:hypothetical protein